MWIIVVGVVLFCVICLFVPLNGASSKGLDMKGIAKVAKLNLLFNYCGVIGTVDDQLHRRRSRYVMPKKVGQAAVITGGARGIGLEVVKLLLKCEMDVVIGCRNVNAGEEALKKIREEGIQGGKARVYPLDMESMASVRKFAAKVREDFPKVHVLINNAGIMMVPFKLIKSDDTPAMESHFAVNYAGHFLLTHLLLPSLIAGGKDGPEYARVVNVSSIAHVCGDIDFEDIMSEKCYIPSAAYGQSKLAQILCTIYSEKLFQKSGIPIHMYAVHPGVCDTDLFDGTYIKKVAPWVLRVFFKSPKRGAFSIMFPAVSPKAESLGGTYLSNCRSLKPSATALDESKAKELFNYTCNLLGIENFEHPTM